MSRACWSRPAISGITVGTVDATDMCRAAVVQSVAAFDSYIHDIVLDLAVDIVLGIRTPGSTNRLGLHFGAVSQVVTAATQLERELRARAVVNDRLSTETFQKADDIAKALAIVGVKGIWKLAFPADPQAAILALNLVVRRRNQIAHRCDLDPANPPALLPLSDGDALDAVQTIENTVTGVDAVI